MLGFIKPVNMHMETGIRNSIDIEDIDDVYEHNNLRKAKNEELMMRQISF
jgi:hypothetical protein